MQQGQDHSLTGQDILSSDSSDIPGGGGVLVLVRSSSATCSFQPYRPRVDSQRSRVGPVVVGGGGMLLGQHLACVAVVDGGGGAGLHVRAPKAAAAAASVPSHSQSQVAAERAREGDGSGRSIGSQRANGPTNTIRPC